MEEMSKADEEEQSFQGRSSEISTNSSNPNPSSLTDHLRNPMKCKQESKDELDSTRAEIAQVKEENERLKTTLAQKIKDYRSLQTKFTVINNKEQTQLTNPNQSKSSTGASLGEEDAEKVEQKKLIEPELQMSLSLGGSSSRGYHRDDLDDHDVKRRRITNKEKEGDNQKDLEDEGLELGLNFGYDQKKKKINKEKKSELSKPTHASVDVEKDDDDEEEEKNGGGDKEEVAITKEEAREVDEKKEGWVSRKILKNMRSGNDDDDDDLQYNPSKKARVSVRARCDGLMINDGCQWRKYGQKISKGNPCPRSYYRCTVAAGCPVRKQVQRCAEDMTILTTTYEGKHSHHIPPAATAMASTTTAAVNMMLSGASSSRPSSGGMTPVSGLNGLNLSFPGNSRGRPHLSISPSHPTITLDLTVPELPSPASSQHTHQASRFPLMNLGSSSSRFYPSPFNHPSMESSTAPVSWSGGYLGYHGAQLFGGGNRDPFMLHNNGSGVHTTQESFYNRLNLQMMDNNKVQLPTSLPQNSLTDTISAATKAITSDPNFQSALAVTVATVLSGGSGRNNQERGDTLGLGLKREDYISSVLPYPPNWKNNLAAQRPSLAFSNQKKDNSSPPANRE